MIRIFNIVALLAWAGVLVVTVTHKTWMWNAFIYSSYYIILALTVAWVYSLINLGREKKADLALFIKFNWKGILFSFVLASIIFVSVPKYFRVLSDETNLLSVAKSMTFYKHVYNVMEGTWHFEMFWPVTPTFIEKRPLLFPFFTSLLHTFLGYRAENVFILNYFVLWAALFLLYLLIRSSLGELLAFASLLLVMAQPILSWSATSGSYELFNLLFMLISFISLRYFLRNPGYSSFLVLVLNLIMLSNIRYESPLFFIVVMVALGLGRYIRAGFLLRSPLYAAAPFFLLPWIWQRTLMLTEPNSDFLAGTWFQEFRLDSARENFPMFWKYILRLNGELGYAGVINSLGILAAIYFTVTALIAFRKRNFDRNQMVLWIPPAFCILMLFAGAMFFHASIAANPMNGRYYMAVLVMLSILPVFFLAHILKDKGRRLGVPVFLGALVLFVFYHPVAIEDRTTRFIYITREFRFVLDFLKKNADQRALVICDRPGQLIVYNYGAIHILTANRDIDKILQSYKTSLFSSIYVVQPIGQTPLESAPLDPRYQLETVAESQMSGSYLFRISRVKIPE